MPEMTGLQPVIDLNGNNNCGGALIGGAIGGTEFITVGKAGNTNHSHTHGEYAG